VISATLKAIFLGGILPALLTAATAAFPPLGIALSIPIIGPGIRKLIDWVFDYLLDKGIIELKVGLIDQLSESAKRHYEPEITMLREAQSRPSLTPEEEAEYAKRLQELVKNRPGIVNG
jgi:hypothetical protein